MVHGAHDRTRVRANRVGIEIEAALAFGTGHHGSTRGCLLALDRMIKQESRKRTAMLDIGTGTGVLAIAAAKALRHPVLAGDIDARAVATARNNARINHVAGHVEIVRGAGVGSHRILERSPFALIFANILARPLIALAPSLARLLAPKGRIILSGLTGDQQRDAHRQQPRLPPRKWDRL
jgi:ribosomal protein L11 methyltransferase